METSDDYHPKGQDVTLCSLHEQVLWNECSFVDHETSTQHAVNDTLIPSVLDFLFVRA